MAETYPLVQTLPAIARLATTYAPARARPAMLAMLALDARLAGLIRNSREPMLAQLRLAWWRETLGQNPDNWPDGEPLLSALRSWHGAHHGLVSLVEGWEALTMPPPLSAQAVEAYGAGRGRAAEGLASVVGAPQDALAAYRLGRIWAVEDLAMRLTRPEERAAVMEVIDREPSELPKIGRALRPIRVLAALARRRRLKGDADPALSPGAMLHAMRVGLLGL